MAFYEMLPGAGMPPGLQAGMDSVLNKKFGTSTTYPAEDWPDTVNLMGPLPEKTVSRSIVTFSDGADEVPLKKCEITLPASLDGYSEVDVIHAGKNLLNDSIRGRAGSNIFFAHDTGLQTDFAVRLKAGIYTYSVVTADGTVSNLYIKDSDTNANITGFPAYATLSKTFTLEKDTNCAVYVYKQGYTDVTDIVSAQIEVGSSATTYEPYTAPTTHTASLGRTIYGGSVDVVTGQGTSTHGLYTFTGNEVYVQQTNQVAVRVAFSVGSSYQTGLDTAISAVEDFVAGGCGDSNYLYVKTAMTAEDLKTYMANHTVNFTYVLASFETFTFDPVPIDSKLGNNTIWSEQGSAEVTYRADINLALGGN